MFKVGQQNDKRLLKLLRVQILLHHFQLPIFSSGFHSVIRTSDHQYPEWVENLPNLNLPRSPIGSKYCRYLFVDNCVNVKSFMT